MSALRSNEGLGDARPGDSLGEAIRSFPVLPAPDGLVEEIFAQTIGAERRAARRRVVALAAAAALALAAAGVWLVATSRGDRDDDHRARGATPGPKTSISASGGADPDPGATGEALTTRAEDEEELERLDEGARRALSVVAATLGRAEHIAVDQILAAEAGHAASLLPLSAAGTSADDTRRTRP